jgi:hypothetical protein
MSRQRVFITNSFIERMRRKGNLALAVQRHSSQVATHEPLPHMTTWALVCEEVLDTEFPPQHYGRVVAELFRRGITPAELEQMRVFAWETAGWLNFEKMVWDWCSLDENDIKRAIQWQFDEGEIDNVERGRRLSYLHKYAQPAPPLGTQSE